MTKCTSKPSHVSLVISSPVLYILIKSCQVQTGTITYQTVEQLMKHKRNGRQKRWNLWKRNSMDKETIPSPNHENASKSVDCRYQNCSRARQTILLNLKELLLIHVPHWDWEAEPLINYDALFKVKAFICFCASFGSFSSLATRPKREHIPVALLAASCGLSKS